MKKDRIKDKKLTDMLGTKKTSEEEKKKPEDEKKKEDEEKKIELEE